MFKLQKLPMVAVGCGIAVLCLINSAQATEVTAEKKLIQPVTVPGKWKMRTTKPFPALKTIIAKTGAGEKIYGIYSWAGEYKTHRKSIKKVGWKQCRIAGPWNDDIMRMVIEDGIEVMPTLGTFITGKKMDRTDYASDDAFVAGTVTAIEKFLTRYGPGGTFFKDNPKLPKRPVKYIELWNEPNFQYIIPLDKTRPRQEIEAEREKLYAKLLTTVYKAVKKRWPQVKVIGFAAGGESAGDLRFIKHLNEQYPAVKASYDILSTHPYIGSAPPEEDSLRPWGSYSLPNNLAIIRQTLKTAGRADCPIWYTEIGWPISQQEGGRFKDRHHDRIVPKILQAAYIVRTYAMALRLGVERVNIMFIVDSDGFNGGFFLRNGKWRTAAYAVETMIKIMPDPQLTGAISDGDNGYYAYTFKSNVQQQVKQSVMMLWNVNGPKTVTIPVQGKVEIINMLGQVKTATPVAGKLKVAIGPCPVYIKQL
jgi:hypothetical protein